MMSAIIDHLLGISVSGLKADIAKVENTWAPATHHLFITHNHKDTIQVYGGIEYKAYVPKRYYAWKVTFTEWNGEVREVDLWTI